MCLLVQPPVEAECRLSATDGVLPCQQPVALATIDDDDDDDDVDAPPDYDDAVNSAGVCYRSQCSAAETALRVVEVMLPAGTSRSTTLSSDDSAAAAGAVVIENLTCVGSAPAPPAYRRYITLSTDHLTGLSSAVSE